MRRKVATAIIMLALLAMAGVPAIANASSPDETKSDLSSLPEIEAYLGSIGVDMGSVVVQQGRLNYAGPDCPGAEWNCTTASKVVQLAPASLPAANLVDCTPAINITLLGLNECVIVQSSVSSLVETGNSASCNMSASDGAKQKCSVRQSSRKGNNYAEVRASTKQWGGSPQSASQDANIEQTSDTGHNTAKINQTIEQTLSANPSSPITQEQQARQVATVNQKASTSGANWSYVWQYQSQEENACGDADITQKQNASSTAKNQEASITQQSGTGNNTSNFTQRLNQHQSAMNGAASITQTQGTFNTGGQQADVSQAITTPNTGIISSTPNQEENQDQDADMSGVLIQAQIGPQDCCSTQVGGTAANVNKVVQKNVQQNDTGLSSQSSVQLGDCVAGAAGATCSIDQTYTQNGNFDNDFTSGPGAQSNAHFCSGVNAGDPCAGD
jgi:hypothetical protein